MSGCFVPSKSDHPPTVQAFNMKKLLNSLNKRSNHSKIDRSKLYSSEE